MTNKWDADAWLDKDSGWHVAYHGTRGKPKVLKSIVENGFKIRGGKRTARNGEVHGPGIYCSPVVSKAQQYADEALFYDSDDKYDGTGFLTVFMCRVKPGKYRVEKDKIWRVTNPKYIRPTGILVKSCQ